MKRTIALFMAAFLLLCAGCGDRTNSSGANGTDEEVVQSFDRSTPVGACGYANQQLREVTHRTFVVNFDTETAVEADYGTVYIYGEQTIHHAERLDQGRILEASYTGVYTTMVKSPYGDQSDTRSGSMYQTGGVQYLSSSDAGQWQMPVEQETLTGVEVSLDGVSFPLEEALPEASMNEKSITTRNFSFSHQEVNFQVDELEITLLDNGLFDVITATGSYSRQGSPVVDFSYQQQFTSYTEAEIEVLEGCESFPVQEGGTTVDDIAIGVVNELDEDLIRGYFIIPGSARIQFPAQDGFAVSTPSTLLLLAADDSGCYGNPAPFSPETHGEYFLTSTAEPIDGYNKDDQNKVITVTVDGQTVNVGWEYMLLDWNGSAWELSDLETAAKGGNYYFVYDSHGADAVRLIVQQHETYMP